MNFKDEGFYHLYNRGINRKTVFFTSEHYKYFLWKVKKYLKPRCDILAYCLMPNHFHFLIYCSSIYNSSNYISRPTTLSRRTTEPLPDSQIIHPVSQAVRIILSSYARGINLQKTRTGSLFQQSTKAKFLKAEDHPLTVFNYIHQNPMRGGIANHVDDWQFSSFREYFPSSVSNICNTELAHQLLDLPTKNDLFTFSSKIVDEFKHWPNCQ